MHDERPSSRSQVSNARKVERGREWRKAECASEFWNSRALPRGRRDACAQATAPRPRNGGMAALYRQATISAVTWGGPSSCRRTRGSAVESEPRARTRAENRIDCGVQRRKGRRRERQRQAAATRGEDERQQGEHERKGDTSSGESERRRGERERVNHRARDSHVAITVPAAIERQRQRVSTRWVTACERSAVARRSANPRRRERERKGARGARRYSSARESRCVFCRRAASLPE